MSVPEMSRVTILFPGEIEQDCPVCAISLFPNLRFLDVALS